MINTKIKEGGGHLGISLLVTGMTPKIFNKRLKPILFETYKIDTLVDEIIYLDGPLRCPPNLIPSLPNDCLTFTDAINPLWVLPLGLDSTDIRDSLREKDCKPQDLLNTKHSLSFMPSRAFSQDMLQENFLLFVSHLSFNPSASVPFSVLAKCISSFFLLG